MSASLPLLLCAAVPLLAQAPARPVRGVEELKAFYADNCARCHGADGAAMGPDGKRLKGADLTDAKALAKATDAGMAKTILKGTMFGLAMPSFKDQLSQEEALALVSQVLRKAQKGTTIAPQAPAK